MHEGRLDRGALLRGAAAIGLGALSVPAGPALAAFSGPPAMTPDQAMKKLMDGNAKFVAGELEATQAIAERRTDVAAVQRPFAMVLCCADSRVPPEHVFDQSIGALFVCRVAGNILEPGGLGSFEYAIANIGSPALLMVLGHQRCGAVTDTIKLIAAGKSAPPSIRTIVEDIRPAVRTTPRGTLSETEYTEAVVRAHARSTARAVTSRSPIIAQAVAEKYVKVVAAHYSIDSGKVTLLT
jgi:carbonic anhydrase